MFGLGLPDFRYLTPSQIEALPPDWKCSCCLYPEKTGALIGHMVLPRIKSKGKKTDPELELNLKLIEKTGHVFHSECVESWLRNSKGSCPICRVVCDYRVVPKDTSGPSWRQRVEEIAKLIFEYVKQPSIYTIYTGVGATIASVTIVGSLTLFTLGTFLMRRGFAIAEHEYRPSGTYYKTELDRLRKEVDNLLEQRDQAALAIPYPINVYSREFEETHEVGIRLRAKRNELEKWEDNTRLKDEYFTYRVSKVVKVLMSVLFTASAFMWVLAKTQIPNDRTV